MHGALIFVLLCGAAFAGIEDNVPKFGNRECVKAHSAGASMGNYAQFFVNNVQTTFPTTRGINIAIISGDGTTFESGHTFDPWGNGAASAALIAFLDAIGTDKVVAMAVLDTADGLSVAAKAKIAEFGSTAITLMGHQQSWALVGRRGATNVAEQVSSNSPAFASLCQPKPTQVPVSHIKMQSAGFNHLVGNARHSLIVNNVPFAGIFRGYNMAVFDLSGALVSTVAYDTWGNVGAADQMAAVIEGLAPNQAVAITVLDEGTVNVNQRLRDAIATLGSTQLGALQHRQSWCLIGYKGAAGGTVQEYVDAPSSLEGYTTRDAATQDPAVAAFCDGIANHCTNLQSQCDTLRALNHHVTIADDCEAAVAACNDVEADCRDKALSCPLVN
jgi:hypothetical protein